MKSCPKCHTAMQEGELFCPNCGTKAISHQMEEHALAVASVWPDWNLEEELGKGSYGIVYKATLGNHNYNVFNIVYKKRMFCALRLNYFFIRKRRFNPFNFYGI